MDNSITGPVQFPLSNVVGTTVMLDAARRKGIERFLHISTDEVYGSMGLDEASWTEESPIKPRSPYSASKAAAENMVNAYHITFNVPTLITRSSNNYGPYQHPEKLIPKFVTNLIRGLSVPLMGTPEKPGLNVRDWLHVKDNCRAIYHVLMHGEIGEAYNIAGENEWTNMQITRTILNHLGYGEEKIQFIPDRLGHDLRYSINSDKLKNTGFELKHKDFKSELERTIDWYVQHERWWRPLIK